MGYDVHITRKENWFDEDDTTAISLEEWKTIVENDVEMRMDNYAEATTADGETIRIESEGIAVWTKYSGDGKDGNHAWFSFYKDLIIVKNPDDEIIAKMLEIALLLKAKVQGDEGEVYTINSSNDIVTDNVDINKKANSIATGKPWWKFW